MSHHCLIHHNPDGRLELSQQLLPVLLTSTSTMKCKYLELQRNIKSIDVSFSCPPRSHLIFFFSILPPSCCCLLEEVEGSVRQLLLSSNYYVVEPAKIVPHCPVQSMIVHQYNNIPWYLVPVHTRLHHHHCRS